MSDWENFLTNDNFNLAWQRILRSLHFENKDRIGLRVYSANLEANLDHLINQLGQGVYEPESSEKIYMPKRAGTLRSLAVLSIKDRIVYQAIGNILAAKTKNSFEAVVDGHVFAHLLTGVNSPYMLRRWGGSNGQYSQFIRKFRRLWEEGNRWVVEADLASYYDSLDHELLCNELKNRWSVDERLVEQLSRCLRAWTPHELGQDFSRGVPQGYEVSDYLATLFLLPADEQMIQSGHTTYIRYVDDIRILAQDKESANQALIKLDIALKQQALVLQPSKTGSREITDINEEIDRQSYLLSMIDNALFWEDDVSVEVETLFFSAWHRYNTNADKFAETHLVFALTRLDPSRHALNVAEQLLGLMPWRSNSITAFLSQFDNQDPTIVILLREIANHRIYAWHVSNCIRALAMICPPNRYRSLIQRIISDRRLRWYQRLAAVESLQHDPNSYGFLLLNYQNEGNYIVRTAMLVAAATTASSNQQRAEVIRRGLTDTNGQVQATAVWLFLEYPDCGITETEFGEELGVNLRMLPQYGAFTANEVCFIETKFESVFEVTIPNGLSFRNIFNPDYQQAVIHLQRALSYYDTDPVAFVTSIDNFNHIIAIQISEKIDTNTIPRDQFGNILNSVMKNHRVLGAHFLDCHDLRSRSLGPHPWATSLGTWSQDINHREKEAVMRDLKIAYQHFVNIFADHFGISVL